MNIILYNPESVNLDDIQRASELLNAVIIQCYNIENIELKQFN